MIDVILLFVVVAAFVIGAVLAGILLDRFDKWNDERRNRAIRYRNRQR